MTRSITTPWSNFWLIMQRNKSLEILQEDAPDSRRNGDEGDVIFLRFEATSVAASP